MGNPPPSGTTANTARGVVVQLLSPTNGMVLKTWKIAGKNKISIGRETGCDIEVLDPFVSRKHAELVHNDGKWWLVSQGRNGILVHNLRVEEIPLHGEVTFRLGSAGPEMRFLLEGATESNMATLCVDTAPITIFMVDEAKVQNEVGAITAREEFRRLQEHVRELRRKRQSCG